MWENWKGKDGETRGDGKFLEVITDGKSFGRFEC
jgi:hypothetical protein